MPDDDPDRPPLDGVFEAGALPPDDPPPAGADDLLAAGIAPAPAISAGFFAPDEEPPEPEEPLEPDEPPELEEALAAPTTVTVSCVLPRIVGSSMNCCRVKPGPSSPLRLTVTVTVQSPVMLAESAVSDQV